MQVHNRRDLIAGMGVVVVGAVYFAATFRIQATNDPVGPETLPRIVGMALIVLGLFIGGTAFRQRSKKSVEPAVLAAASGADDDLPDEPEDPPVQLSKLFTYLALFTAYALLLIPLGFLVSTSLFLFTLTMIYNRSAWKRNIIYSVVFAVVVYYLFKEGLGVFLPAGLIG